MTHITEENKFLAWLTASILVALMAVLVAGIVYMQQTAHYTGKGPDSIVLELTLYTPTLTMAAMLLLLFCFSHSLWRLLFSIALATNVVVIILTIILAFFLNSSETSHRHTSFLDYINGFPFICDVLLVIIYLRKQ